MKKLFTILTIGGLVLAFTGSVMALPLNSGRPFNGFGTSGEPSLQSIFDSTIVGGTVDAVKDQSDAAIWTPSGDGDVDAYKIAAYRGDSGTLGIYSYATGAKYEFTFLNNTAGFSINDAGDLYVDGVAGPVITGFGRNFGFFWHDTTTNFYAYTEDSKNENGAIQALSYQLDAGLKVKTQANGGTTYTATGDDWILAFEDRKFAGSDKDFNDAVFYIEDVSAVPEPSTVLLLGAGVLGMVAFGRKYVKK